LISPRRFLLPAASEKSERRQASWKSAVDAVTFDPGFLICSARRMDKGKGWWIAPK
jgi:hypothetical protein